MGVKSAYLRPERFSSKKVRAGVYRQKAAPASKVRLYNEMKLLAALLLAAGDA
jgi:hypothetical protein